MQEVIERCRRGQVPDVLIGEHYGYYRHDDIRALLSAHEAMLEALTMALPYVEMAEHDEAYKNGVVRKAVNQIRAAIAKATGNG